MFCEHRTRGQTQRTCAPVGLPRPRPTPLPNPLCAPLPAAERSFPPSFAQPEPGAARRRWRAFGARCCSEFAEPLPSSRKQRSGPSAPPSRRPPPRPAPTQRALRRSRRRRSRTMEGGSHLPPLHLVLLRLAPAHGERSLLLVRILRLVRHDGRGRYARSELAKSTWGRRPDAGSWVAFLPNRERSRAAATPTTPAQHRGKMGMHLWQVVGRHVPTDRNPKPKIFRMKVFAEDEVRARRLAFSSPHIFSGAERGSWRRCRRGSGRGGGARGCRAYGRIVPLFGTPRGGG